MTNNNDKANENLQKTIDLMNLTLGVEYSCIVHFPRLSSIVKDEEIQDLIAELGEDSTRHASIVAEAISELGGNPAWAIEPFPDDTEIIDIFRMQLEKEELAFRLHSQNAKSQVDSSIQSKLEDIAKDEAKHIQIVKRILSKLTEHEKSE
ncbi:ferritin-like domain-containing protein [Chloroflexota bacterium]